MFIFFACLSSAWCSGHYLLKCGEQCKILRMFAASVGVRLALAQPAGGTSSRHGCASRGTLGSLPSASSREQKNNICNTARERITSNSEAFVSTFQKKKKKYRLLLPYVFSIFYRLCILHTHSQLFPFMNNMPCASPLGFRYSTLPCMFI